MVRVQARVSLSGQGHKRFYPPHARHLDLCGALADRRHVVAWLLGVRAGELPKPAPLLGGVPACLLCWPSGWVATSHVHVCGFTWQQRVTHYAHTVRVGAHPLETRCCTGS